ncbi:MAG: IS256 family transposase, partial [Nitrososphaerota archaeon]|nr:IS256 family transposase [Nitrososphaerota archaeon]
MVNKAIKCIHCGSENIVKNGKHSNGKQRLKCKKCVKIFQEEYSN